MSWSEDYHVEPEEFRVDHSGGGLTENVSVRTVVAKNISSNTRKTLHQAEITPTKVKMKPVSIKKSKIRHFLIYN